MTLAARHGRRRWVFAAPAAVPLVLVRGGRRGVVPRERYS